MLAEPQEKWRLGVVRVLEWPVGDVVRLLVGCGLKVGWQFVEGRACDIEAGVAMFSGWR